MRGFHLRKANWRCKRCTTVDAERGESSKKRTRSNATENFEVSEITFFELVKLVDKLTKTMDEINQKLQMVFEENKKLHSEILFLKDQKTQQLAMPSFSEAVRSNKNQLLIRPKEKLRINNN